MGREERHFELFNNDNHFLQSNSPGVTFRKLPDYPPPRSPPMRSGGGMWQERSVSPAPRRRVNIEDMLSDARNPSLLHRTSERRTSGFSRFAQEGQSPAPQVQQQKESQTPLPVRLKRTRSTAFREQDDSPTLTLPFRNVSSSQDTTLSQNPLAGLKEFAQTAEMAGSSALDVAKAYRAHIRAKQLKGRADSSELEQHRQSLMWLDGYIMGLEGGAK